MSGYIANKDSLKADPNIKWLDLDGYKTVWLKITFGKTEEPINYLDFLLVPTEKMRIVSYCTYINALTSFNIIYIDEVFISFPFSITTT